MSEHERPAGAPPERPRSDLRGRAGREPQAQVRVPRDGAPLPGRSPRPDLSIRVLQSPDCILGPVARVLATLPDPGRARSAPVCDSLDVLVKLRNEDAHPESIATSNAEALLKDTEAPFRAFLSSFRAIGELPPWVVTRSRTSTARTNWRPCASVARTCFPGARSGWTLRSSKTGPSSSRPTAGSCTSPPCLCGALSPTDREASALPRSGSSRSGPQARSTPTHSGRISRSGRGTPCRVYPLSGSAAGPRWPTRLRGAGSAQLRGQRTGVPGAPGARRGARSRQGTAGQLDRRPRGARAPAARVQPHSPRGAREHRARLPLPARIARRPGARDGVRVRGEPPRACEPTADAAVGGAAGARWRAGRLGRRAPERHRPRDAGPTADGLSPPAKLRLGHPDMRETKDGIRWCLLRVPSVDALGGAFSLAQANSREGSDAAVAAEPEHTEPPAPAPLPAWIDGAKRARGRPRWTPPQSEPARKNSMDPDSPRPARARVAPVPPVVAVPPPPRVRRARQLPGAPTRIGAAASLPAEATALRKGRGPRGGGARPRARRCRPTRAARRGGVGRHDALRSLCGPAPPLVVGVPPLPGSPHRGAPSCPRGSANPGDGAEGQARLRAGARRSRSVEPSKVGRALGQ